MKIFNKFPLVRLKQFRDNPRFIWYYLKRLFIYKYTSHKYIEKYQGFKFLSSTETLDFLIKNNASLARFSDGDIEQLTGAGEYPPDSDWTQKSSQALILKLEEVLHSNEPKLLLAHESPEVFCVRREDSDNKKVVYNMWTDTRRLLFHYLKKEQIYGHAHAFIPDHNPNFDWQKLYHYLKNRDVIIVTGGVSKLFGVFLGRRMFFVEAGKHNAFERYDVIKQDLFDLIEREKLQKEEVLIMTSLGPTADILALDFTKQGWQVWDTGHFFKFADKKIRELSKQREIFTKQLFNLKENEIKNIFQKSLQIYEASLKVEGLVMPKILSHTETTILFERLNLPPTFLELLKKNQVWEKEWFLRIGKVVGNLHKQLLQDNKIGIIHGDLVIHNLALGEKDIFLFDAEPSFFKNKNKEEGFIRNSYYTDLAKFIISLITGFGFKKKFFKPKRNEFILEFLQAFEKGLEVSLDRKKLGQALDEELDFWVKWQLDFGYNYLVVQIKYYIVKIYLGRIKKLLWKKLK